MVWERQTEPNGDGGIRMETATLILNFFSWLYHSEFSSSPHLAYLWLLSLSGVLQRRRPATRWRHRDWQALFWSQAETDTRQRFPVSHVGICIYPFITLIHFRSTTWLLPLIFTCAPCVEKSLMDASVTLSSVKSTDVTCKARSG